MAMTILHDPWATLVFAVACSSSGALVTALFYEWFRKHSQPTIAAPRLSDVLDGDLRQRAHAWANTRGTPDLAGWAHRRLRTFVDAHVPGRRQ